MVNVPFLNHEEIDDELQKTRVLVAGIDMLNEEYLFLQRKSFENSRT